MSRTRHEPRPSSPTKPTGRPGPGSSDAPDAGLRSLHHYKRALPPWRYALRQKMLPLIRWETPYLAWLQAKLRTPALDSYFAITANLGTHTFFMVCLPMLFWCGSPSVGKSLVHILALGVFWTGFLKDFYSLPRPLSPPLHRITMSGSAALEYGFPSTHSANAVSVAVYALLKLRNSEPASAMTTTSRFLDILALFYAASIVVGRLYCGMHGFLDVIIGSLLGTAIALLEFSCGPFLDIYMHQSSWMAPCIAAVLVIILVRIHPEPADDCPCFDDSVAFAGVLIGLEFGTWTYGKISFDPWAASAHSNGTVNVASLGWAINASRIVFGVLVIFAWRETMKPFLLRCLPHLFRWIDQLGLSLPRRFFTPASEYKTVPPGSRLDTLFPSASDFPRMVESIRYPTTRGRSVSIGPQSAADAYETLAYRERRRRESNSGSRGSQKQASSRLAPIASGLQDDVRRTAHPPSAAVNLTAEKEQNESDSRPMAVTTDDDAGDFITRRANEMEEREMFSRLVRPRVRYDVEVVTKLVVYAGISCLATAGIPILFEFVGLGTNHLLQ